ncbi:hypothetical protein WIS52_14870 [Pseudonocardia nematodicida]|uniref:PE-PGRS family protein n=1 Tax=Pseudonocardia nematodicida TaxID=1206997 RepID=A0ABV1KBU8_9PSEU
MSSPEPAVGERWAYRARAIDRVTEVEVLKIGTNRPPRVRVRFVDEAQEGREEWVPPARLKVPWAQGAEWQQLQDRWEAARVASGSIRDSIEERAAWNVEESLPDWPAAELGYNNDAGLMFIRDVDAVCQELGLDRVDLEHPASFQTASQLVVPWPVTETVLQRRAMANADVLLTELHRQQQQAERGMRWGRSTGYGGYYEPEMCAEFEVRDRPARELVRRWCGADAVARADELAALREEVRRIGRITEEAITALRDHDAKLAGRLERELGVPLEDIRANRQRSE